MNYSDYDSDGYSSNEDADYLPSGKYAVLHLTIGKPENQFRLKAIPVPLRHVGTDRAGLV